MNAETKAALERAANLCEYHGIEWGVAAGQNTVTDAALIRAHIASEASAYEAGKADAVAQIVAWLRVQSGEKPGMFQQRNLARSIAAKEFSTAIESGAHERNGDD
jgi:hypothetical protein